MMIIWTMGMEADNNHFLALLIKLQPIMRSKVSEDNTFFNCFHSHYVNDSFLRQINAQEVFSSF